MNSRHSWLVWSALLLACVGGCAHYEYDLVRPPELSRHIGAKAWEVVTLDPLEYRLRTSDNRLVILTGKGFSATAFDEAFDGLSFQQVDQFFQFAG